MSEDWWPKPFQHIADEDPLASDYVTIAEIISNEKNGFKGSRFISTALIDTELLKRIESKSIHYQVHKSGPYPSYTKDRAYNPKFWIWSVINNKEIYLEPLIIYWVSFNTTVLMPDQGLLMTYGLIPRVIKENDEISEIIWDELSLPQYDVIKIKPISKYDCPNHSEAFIKIKKEYLQDYATLRYKAIIQIYFEYRDGKIDSDIEEKLSGKRYIECFLKDRNYLISKSDIDAENINAEINGYRCLFKPGKLPVSSDEEKLEPLSWPGIDEPINEQNVGRICSQIDKKWVYVDDSVLGKFEGDDKYGILSESGAVYYESRWGVSFCRRLGKHIIVLELRKLYEGAPPEIIKHWHKHAVEPPKKSREELYKEKSIVEYAKELIYSQALFGEELVKAISKILSAKITCKDIVGFDEKSLEYYGWCKVPNVEPITRHIPPDFKKDQFIKKCANLHKLLVEILPERILRQSLIKFGVNENDIIELRSLKLLNYLLELIKHSLKRGLDIINNSVDIIKTCSSDNKSFPLRIHFTINDMRQINSHIQGKTSKDEFRNNLKEFGIDPSSVVNSYESAIERRNF